MAMIARVLLLEGVAMVLFTSLNKSLLSPGAFLKLMLLTMMFYCRIVGAIDNSTEAYEKLSMVTHFSIGSSGFVGHKSDGEHYMEEILLEKNPEKILINIASTQTSTLEAKLYAACGLSKLSNRNFDDLFKSNFEKQVSVLKTDILRKEKFHDIYSWIQRYGCH